MTFETPCSPSHCLLMLNETMHSDILRLVHETVYALKDKEQRSPLAYLIESLETTLDRYQHLDSSIIDINPFNADPRHPFTFNPERAYSHDMKLLAFQLEALKKIRSELSSF